MKVMLNVIQINPQILRVNPKEVNYGSYKIHWVLESWMEFWSI